jgi:hypothetical protein
MRERPMPLQNRVTPFSQIVAFSDRGLFMGNRGCLHDDRKNLVRQTCSERRWIICLTSFKSRKRELMTPGNYTELFFLDEATALAAGHRPCSECRRQDYDRFKAAWITGNPDLGFDSKTKIAELDRQLHADRLNLDKTQRTFTADPASLPDGVFLAFPDGENAYLWWKGKLLRWTPAGYLAWLTTSAPAEAVVLTPRSTVAAIRAGYSPVLHGTA